MKQRKKGRRLRGEAGARPAPVLHLYTAPTPPPVLGLPWPCSPAVRPWGTRPSSPAPSCAVTARTAPLFIHIFPDRCAARPCLPPRREPGMSQSCVPLSRSRGRLPALSKCPQSRGEEGKRRVAADGQQCHVLGHQGDTQGAPWVRSAPMKCDTGLQSKQSFANKTKAPNTSHTPGLFPRSPDPALGSASEPGLHSLLPSIRKQFCTSRALPVMPGALTAVRVECRSERGNNRRSTTVY